MNKHSKIISASLISLLVAGCAGRADVQSIASQSAIILSQTQVEAGKFGTAQTRLNTVLQNNIATFNSMSSAADQAVKTRQATWLDPKMKAVFLEVKASDPAVYIARASSMTATTQSGPVVEVGTQKIRAAVAQLNGLAKEQNLTSQVTFLVEFAKGVKGAYDERQKKATDLSVAAGDKAAALDPAATPTPTTP